MTAAVIFAGPSILGLDRSPWTELVFLPPAKQGDVYRAALARPRAIGIIDGYFDGVPSVWHKEILWALSQGIRVFGGASMGALRAAELDVFGMAGIGRIYRWYCDGILEDDDEVALVHGPEDTDFLPLSEPMVNVRASCEAAVRAGAVDQATAEAIVAIAKRQHYRERTWDSVLAAADVSALEEFRSWIAAGRIDQKRLDAAELIRAVAAFIGDSETARLPDFRFEWTDLWDRVSFEWTTSESPSGDREDVSQSVVVDELRLEPHRYAAVRSQALQQAVLLREAHRWRVSVDRPQKLEQLGRLRERLGLMRKADLDAWVRENGMDADELDALMEDAARIEVVSRLSPRSVDRQIMANSQGRRRLRRSGAARQGQAACR